MNYKNIIMKVYPRKREIRKYISYLMQNRDLLNKYNIKFVHKITSRYEIYIKLGELEIYDIVKKDGKVKKSKDLKKLTKILNKEFNIDVSENDFVTV